MSKKLFGGRTLARSQALQLLFQAEANGRTVEEVLAGDYVIDCGPLDDFGRDLAMGCDKRRYDVDAIIATRSMTWSLFRLPAVDRNLLRLALYEMLLVDEVDIPVTINESVELAKAYGTEESSAYINGILGRVADDIEAGVDVVKKAYDALAERDETIEDLEYMFDARFDVYEEPEIEHELFGSDREDEMSGGVYHVEGPGANDEDDEDRW